MGLPDLGFGNRSMNINNKDLLKNVYIFADLAKIMHSRQRMYLAAIASKYYQI